MIPVNQEFIHIEGTQYGDCQRAVVASLLELPISDVPHFLHEAEGDSLRFWTHLQQFLAKHGCIFMEMALFDVEEYSWLYGTPAIYHEIYGPSPRGGDLWHTTVGCNGKIVHDPHPSKAGLAGQPSDWKFGLYVRINGARP
jgi:hypothetical protein